jgi:peptidyl-prolyl cis-trans isomerase D
MAESVGKKASKVFVWILLALLIVGLAGFGIGSFGGSTTAVGRVGDQEITAQQYFRALDQAIRAERQATGAPVTRARAEATGLMAEVQGQLAGQAALDGETADLGLSVSDDVVGERILQTEAFQGPNGAFDRQTYEFVLRQNGWTVPEYEEEVRADQTRALLQAAAAGGIAPPDAFADTVMGYVGERRSFAWRRFGPEDLDAPLPEPTDADLRAHYEAAEDAYRLPQTKRITYAWLTPAALADTLEPEEGAVEALYEERIDDYVQPERRLVERLVFESAAAAQRAATALETGETDFGALVRERGLTLQDVDLGDVARDDLGAAAEPVFALDGPGVVGPVETSLGPALFRVNAILDARDIPLSEVRDELAREASIERARRMLSDMVDEFDDRLAAGATLEDLGDETEMEVGTLDWFPGVGTEAGEIVGYERFREAARAAQEGDFPQIEILGDDSLFALRVDEVVPPRVPPLADIRATVADDWRAAERTRRLAAQAEAARADLTGGDELGASGAAVETAEEVTRDATLEGVPPALIARAFEMEEGARAVVEGEGAAYLLELREIAPPDDENQRVALLRQALESQATQGMANDALQLYVRGIMAREGVSFDQPALNAVHSQVFN